MRRLFSLSFSLALLLLCGCAPSDNMQPGNGVTVSFQLEAGGATRSNTVLPQDSTVRVIAYRQVQGQTGYPETGRAGECTYRMTAAGLVPCAVRPDGTADSLGTSLGDMELAPGAYTFYTVSPALRVYHESANPMVAVNHGTDFGVSVTPYTVRAGANSVTLASLSRKCCRLRFLTERNGVFSGITKLRVQSLTLEEMSNQPMWMTGTQSFELPGNAYSSTVRIGKDAFKVPAGNADYRQVAEVNCLPREKKDFRMRVSVLYNNDTIPTILETTVKTTEFVQGSLNVFTLTFGKGTVEVKQEENWQDAAMGDCVDGSEIDLNAQLNNRYANCYIIQDGSNTLKNYSFNARVRGNGQELLGDPDLDGISYSTLPDLSTATEARVIWQTGGWGAVVSQATLVGNSVKFTTGSAMNGNAVIGIFPSSAPDAPCLWSWHIWRVSEPLPPDVVCQKYQGGYDLISNAHGPIVSYSMMGLNLGAYNNWADSPTSIGLLYQWGRKDPFPGSGNFAYKEPDIYGSFYDGSKTVTLNGPYRCPIVPSTVGGTEAWAVAHPAIFITKSDLGGDWLSTQNEDLWGAPWGNIVIWSYNGNEGKKSIYDPCPVGYKVPPCDAVSKQREILVGQTVNGSIMYEVGNTWLPRQGYRAPDTGGLVVDNLGYYWQNTHSYLNRNIMDDFQGACWNLPAFAEKCGVNSGLMNAYGLAIRCIKEVQ